MAEETEQDASSQGPKVAHISNQTVAAAKEVNIDFSQFVSPAEGETISYSIKDFPESFSIDANTGVLTGSAPDVELNESYPVSVIFTSDANENKTTLLFNLDIIGTILLDTPEAKAFFGLEETNLWDMAAQWEIRQFLQQLLNEHFVWICIFDGDNAPETVGNLTDQRQAKSGWTIFEFENLVLISPGDMAFEQYGNRGRLLATLKEVYKEDVAKRGWEVISLDGSDMENVGRAWVVAKLSNVPTKTDAPTTSASINHSNLARLYQAFPPTEPKKLP